MCCALVRVLMVAAHATWLACVGGLADFMRMCAFGTFLLQCLIASAWITITSLCNRQLRAQCIENASLMTSVEVCWHFAQRLV